MNKVGILTLYANNNFGNKLQNFAVQESLKKLGIETETIIYITKGERNIQRDYETCSLSKLDAFKDFNKNIKFYNKKLYMDKEPESDFGTDLDGFSIGSDQIWNYGWCDVFSPKVFADFANNNQKRISFAASIGISNAPEKESEEYKIFEENLKNLDCISVREDVAKDIIKEISGREDVYVILDPTMLLEKEEWENVMKKPEILKTDNFIVKSFLGNISNEALKEIEKLSKETGYEIIDISDENSPYSDIGPAEFLYLEKNAKMVLTDSFHSCVFAILFSAPFVVFKREDNLTSMYSRIETLLNTFNLSYRTFNGKITEEMKESNYDEANKILKNKKLEAFEFLEKAFEDVISNESIA